MADDNKKSEPSPIIGSLEEQSSEEVPAQAKPAPDAPEAGSGVSGSAAAVPSRVRARLVRFFRFSNLYLVIFVLLVILMALGVFTVTWLNKDNEAKDTPSKSLTDQQLAELKGSTTVIGDSQQILDIQSNAVFENQVLMRGNLDVAGTVKVGGPLSLASVTVGGTSSFGQLQVNDTLTVVGNTTLQRNLTVNGAASFSGTLSAGQLNIATLNLTGDLVVSKHIAGSGGIPTRTNGSALGGWGTASVSGSDTAGTVTINTGSAPPAGCFATINFAVSFGATPHVVISPSNSSSAGLNYYTNRTTSNFSVCTTNAPSASTTYLFDYIIFD